MVTKFRAVGKRKGVVCLDREKERSWMKQLKGERREKGEALKK